MAVAAGAKHSLKAGIQEVLGSAQDKGQELTPSIVSEWAENTPSYLAHLQALLAGLTEEDRETIHASLQKE